MAGFPISNNIHAYSRVCQSIVLSQNNYGYLWELHVENSILPIWRW